MQITFNDLYTRYTKGEVGRGEFEGMIFTIIKNEERRIVSSGLKPDECSDFVSWLYPRIHAAIDSYRETGASFGAYMNTVIRLSAKEYRTRIASNSITEYAAWTVRAFEQYVHQEGPEYAEDENNKAASKAKSAAGKTVRCACDANSALLKPPPEDGDISGEDAPPRIKNPKQLLVLILKCYCYVSDDFLDRAAPRVGIQKDKLKGLTDKLRSLRAIHDEELRNMRERVYSQYYRCVVYEKKLSLMQENSAAAIKMEKRLEKARLRLLTMRKRLAGIRCDASNSQVAEVLGITKGAVDASLHSLRNRWNTEPDKIILN